MTSASPSQQTEEGTFRVLHVDDDPEFSEMVSIFLAREDDRFEEEYRQVMETGEPTSFVEYFFRLDGWFDIEAYPTYGGGVAFYFVNVPKPPDRPPATE